MAQSRVCFDTYGLYDDNFRLIEDWPRIMGLLENNVRIHFWDGVAVKYRTATNGVSSGSVDNLVFLSDCLKFQSSLLKKLPVASRFWVSLPYYSLKMYYDSLSYLMDHGGVNMSQLNIRKVYELSKYHILFIVRNMVR